METTITIMKFYPDRNWFWYFRKNKFLKGFIIRVCGIHMIVKEKDSLNKLIHINNIYQELKKNGIKYK